MLAVAPPSRGLRAPRTTARRSRRRVSLRPGSTRSSQAPRMGGGLLHGQPEVGQGGPMKARNDDGGSSFSGLVRKARTVTELSPEDFARILGTEEEVITAWERGTRTPPPIGVRLLELIVARPEVVVSLIALEPASRAVVARTA